MWRFSTLANLWRPTPPPPPPAPPVQQPPPPELVGEFFIDPMFVAPPTGLNAFTPSPYAAPPSYAAPSPYAAAPPAPAAAPEPPHHWWQRGHRHHHHHPKHHGHGAPAHGGGYNPLLLGLLSGEIGCEDGSDLGQSGILKGGRHG